MPPPPAAEDRDAFDLLVIGAGQGGGPLAGAFARAGRRVALVERAHVGGTCVNVGCTPSKTVIASARVAHLAGRAADYGVRLDARDARIDVRTDLRRVQERRRGVVERFRGGSERELREAGVTLLRGHARFVGPRTVEVAPADAPDAPAGPRRLTAGTVVVNTGLRPALPPLDGLDAVPHLTSTSLLACAEAPGHLLVLGGGYVGVELAQAFRRFGSRVTIVQRGAQLLPREDADVADAVAAILRDEGIEVRLDAEAVRVAPDGDGVRLTWRPRGSEGGAGGERTIAATHLLVATGRRPNTDDLGLDRAGVETDARGHVRVDEGLATSAPGVYAIGDVTGGPAFTHVSYDDFRVLRDRLLHGGGATTAGRLVPYTVFTDPQLGAVGMTEREARAGGRRVRVARLPMSRVARAIEVDETRGFLKAVVDADSGRILGARVLGLEGGELATLLQLAMLGGLPYTALRDGVFSHPTLAESLNTLFASFDD